MRKYPLPVSPTEGSNLTNEIDLRSRAKIHFSSESADHPVEHMLDGSGGRGATFWSGKCANEMQTIVFEFDEPQNITQLIFEAEELSQQRTQEVRAEYSLDGGVHYRGLFVQEYTFSPAGATFEREDLKFDLHGVTHVRLYVTPNKHGQGRASLTSLRLFG